MDAISYMDEISGFAPMDPQPEYAQNALHKILLTKIFLPLPLSLADVPGGIGKRVAALVFCGFIWFD